MLDPVVTPFEVGKLPGSLFRPVGVARPVADQGANREPGLQLRPTVVLLDPDPHRHALHHFREFTGYDVPRHERELRASGLVNPDDPAPEGLLKGVDIEGYRVPRRDAGKASL